MNTDEKLVQETFGFESNSDKERETVSDDTDLDEETPDVEPEDFQVALDRLKEVARELESGELPLEEAMERYREGLGLIEFCEDRLEEAELLVEEIDDTVEGAPEIKEKEQPES